MRISTYKHGWSLCNPAPLTADSDSKWHLQDPIATEIQSLEGYWPAEDYHQGYLAKGGRFGNAQSPQKGCTDPIRCYG